MPEMLDERVKTLHPKIHGGLLADRGKESHLADLERHGIQPFDLVVSNLYPFLERPGHRDDRHRRPRDGARVGEEPRVGHGRHQPEPVRPAPRRAARQRRDRERGDATRVRARSVRPHGRVRRRDRAVVAGRRATAAASDASRSSAPKRRCVTARTRTSRPRATAAAVSRVGGTPCSSTAGSRSRTSTSTTPTRRGSSCTISATRSRVRDHQAREPVRRRARGTNSRTRTNARSSATNGPRSAASSR